MLVGRVLALSLRMSHPLRHLQAAALLCACFLPTAPLAAQERDPVPDEERPRVERITFRGVDALDTRELRRSIATEQTRCRSVLLRPFCWLTDWSVFVDKAYLDRAELPRDELRLEVRYFRRGYRDAEVTQELRPRGRGVEVVFTVEEGLPTVVVSREVDQERPVLSERALRWARLPDEGEPLDLIRLDSARVQLQEMIEDEGHLDGAVRDTAEVDRASREARLRVAIDPGPRSTLESFDIRGNEDVSDRTVQLATVLRQGRVIRRRDLVGARRSLYESNLFHEVSVEVPPQPDSAKRVEVEVREAPSRSARVGGGFNTIEFVQTEARFSDHNWLGGGRRLDARLAVGNLLADQLSGRAVFRDVRPDIPLLEGDRAFLRPSWQASLELQQPGFRAAENTIGAGIFTHRRLVPGVAVDQGYGIDFSFTRLLRDRSPTTASYRVEVTQVRAGDLYFCANYGLCDLPTIGAVRRQRRLSPVALSLVANRSDDPLDPVRGWRTRLDLEHASDLTWSQFHYHRASGAWARYFPGDLGRRVLGVRVRGGWVRPLGGTADALGLDLLEGEILHPRKRFYSGGSTSVRGYGENQLGPRILTVSPDALMDPNGEAGCTEADIAAGTCDPHVAPADAFIPSPLGGTTLLEANVEYRFPLWRELRGAVFVDAGFVGGRQAARVGEGAWAITPGIGARYATAVGPIRVDLGFRPRTVEELPVVTEVVGEDGEPGIVRLETPRRWDPLEDAGGFFGQLMGRLRLHVSIGQAF
jgi:outer membrane protein insertion porin family